MSTPAVCLPVPHHSLMAPRAVKQIWPSPLRYSAPRDLFNWFSTLKPNLKSPAEWAGKGSPPSSRCPHIPSLTGGGYGGRFCSHHLPSLGELEKQQGTKVLSVRSAGAQGDPQSKQASPTGETGLCPYPAHAEATTVPFLALGALGGACCFSSYFFP